MSNTFGKIYRLTSFGESHGVALGGVIDGCPAGFPLSVGEVQRELDRRRPGQGSFSTKRHESDKLEILSGLFEGKTTGAPIGFIVRNEDVRSGDYQPLSHVYRPSHADFTWQTKYGIRDYRGGGRSSAREHLVRVVGGAIARQLLTPSGIGITAYTSGIGGVELPYSDRLFTHIEIENSPLRCPDVSLTEIMQEQIEKARINGDTLGGTVTCLITGVPIGLGEPVFGKLHARLAEGMMGINAVKGFEYGEGFRSAGMRGSEYNDPFGNDSGHIRTATNRSGGIQGGISNGEVIWFRVAFKPVPSIRQEQSSVDHSGRPVKLTIEGRHDVCVVPRAVPVVESMAAMTILDSMLLAGLWKHKGTDE